MHTYQEISFKSTSRCHWIDVTSAVNNVIRSSGISNGICVVSSLHTTGGITINENADPDVERDFFWKLAQMIPEQQGYHHAEGNSDSHVKTSLVGLSVQVPVRDGRLVLGTWQSVYFCEFDGPRSRRVSVTLLG
jgi:secondary thiamine-phosphate synthase enzyme